MLSRIQSKFTQAQEAFENLREYAVTAEADKGKGAEAPKPHLSFKAIWLTNQIFKTQYQRGHYKQALESVGTLLDELDAKYSFTSEDEQTPIDAERDKFEYLFFKLVYVKAKLLRKTRQMQECDDTCSFLVDHVKESMQEKAGAKKEGEEAKAEDAATAGAEVKPKAFWKFAVKAAYIKAVALATCMEFAKPKRLMQEFAEPTLAKLLRQFYPELFPSSDKNDGIPETLSAKVLPDNYYSFQHRRVYAKLRRLGYFIPDSLKCYQQLLFDELKHYNLYDFAKYEQDIKDAAELKEQNKFYRATHLVRGQIQDTVSDNRARISALSKTVALANKAFFKEKLAEKLDPTLQEYIKAIGDGEEPFVDRYGRATHYYAQLDDKRIWLYQPGTIMFESGVKGDGDLVVTHGGSQQNGGILGNGCATFLCKFAATLIIKYEKLKKEIELLGPQDGVPRDMKTMSGSAYSIALTRTLAQLALEDATCHGRFLVMKDIFCDLTEDRELADEQLALFYAKDILTLRGKQPTEEAIEEIRQNPPSETEIRDIIKRRAEQSKFNQTDLFFTGKAKVSEQRTLIIDALVGKDGLVADQAKDAFRQELKISLSQADNLPQEEKKAAAAGDKSQAAAQEEKKEDGGAPAGQGPEAAPTTASAFEPDYALVDLSAAGKALQAKCLTAFDAQALC